MSSSSFALPEPVRDYLLAHTGQETITAQKLRVQTAELAESMMQISPEQGQLMQMLLRLMGAQRAIEVGTFTGYSALQIALALPDDGTLVACDISEEWTAIGQPFWTTANVAHKIDLRIGPAVRTLNQLIENGDAGTFDFAFIDADKENYGTYYEQCLTLVRSGGLIAVDNVLWSGTVADPTITDVSTAAIRSLNERVRSDSRVQVSMIPIGDGLSLIRKK